MCGRFTLTSPADVLAEAFGLEDVPALEARYNISPGQDIAVVGRRDADHPPRLALVRWGVPRGGPGAGILINARSESAARASTWAEAFRLRRALVPADGFYEWQPAAGGGRKQPFLATRRDAAPFAMGALWQRGERATCAILTCAPNALLREVHTRMPLILPRVAWGAWLDPRTPPRDLAGLLVPFPADELRLVRVSERVNNARHDDPGCLEPAPA